MKAKTKRICGLEWKEANWGPDALVEKHRTLHAKPGGKWKAVRHLPRLNALDAWADNPRAAVAKLLRLEERVLRELLKGRVE